MANADTDANDRTATAAEPELIGSWITNAGNTLYLLARRGTAYASIWLARDPEPARIGRVKRAGQQVRSIEWDEPWSDQAAAWAAAQRGQAATARAPGEAEGG